MSKQHHAEATPPAKAPIQPMPGSAYSEHQRKQIEFAKRMSGVPKPLPSEGGPPPRADDGPRWLPCAWMHCATRLDISATSAEQNARFAEAHGFVERLNRGGEKRLYCSKWCHERDTSTAEERKATIASKDPTQAPAALTPPTKIRRRAGMLGCDYLACEALLPVAEDEELALRTAAALGFKQSVHGVFCSADCAKRGAQDVAAGGKTRATENA